MICLFKIFGWYLVGYIISIIIMELKITIRLNMKFTIVIII